MPVTDELHLMANPDAWQLNVQNYPLTVVSQTRWVDADQLSRFNNRDGM
jgi:hypothetical protein